MPDERLCYYCGVPADSVDHVVPRVVLRMLEAASDTVEEKWRLVGHNKLLKVRACRECNMFARSLYFDTLEKRKEYVKMQIKKHYRQVLRMPAWSKKELAELDESMKLNVQRSLDVKEWVLARLRW